MRISVWTPSNKKIESRKAAKYQGFSAFLSFPEERFSSIFAKLTPYMQKKAAIHRLSLSAATIKRKKGFGRNLAQSNISRNVHRVANIPTCPETKVWTPSNKKVESRKASKYQGFSAFLSFPEKRFSSIFVKLTPYR
jgi:hypothetical protein